MKNPEILLRNHIRKILFENFKDVIYSPNLSDYEFKRTNDRTANDEYEDRFSLIKDGVEIGNVGFQNPYFDEYTKNNSNNIIKSMFGNKKGLRLRGLGLNKFSDDKFDNALIGKGFGKILLNKIIEHCKNNNVKFLTLRVQTNNTPAYSIYKKYGFKPLFETGNENQTFMYLEL